MFLNDSEDATTKDLIAGFAKMCALPSLSRLQRDLEAVEVPVSG
jgi:hypothetical protein